MFPVAPPGRAVEGVQVIRPSSLTLAEDCDLAASLSERFPHKNENTDRGNDVDDQVKDGVINGVVPADPDAAACVRWVQENMGGYKLRLQEKVTLIDEDTGGVVTEGTPDIAGHQRAYVWIVDVKKREQYDTGRLPEPDDNLQLHAYALAECQLRGASSYRLTLLLFGDGKAEAKTSQEYTVETWTPILERITAINNNQPKNPKGQSGDHCAKCYPRLHCPHWALPAYEQANDGGPLAPLSKPGLLTPDNAGKALMAYQAVKEVMEKAKETLQAYVEANGPIVVGERQWGRSWQPGRMSWDYKAMERDGLAERYAKIGRPFEQFRWGKRKEANGKRK
jgi:CRISPR/Cas system-associated exonuclease Cas4 (RecB family)